MKKILMMVFGIFVSLSLLVVTPAFAKGPNGPAGNSNKAHLYLYEKNPAGWTIVEGGAWGKMTYNQSGPTFDYVFNGHGLQPNTDYSLIYYADPWPGNHPGALIVSGTSNGGGNINLNGSTDIGTDIPNVSDTNYLFGGGKIWLVLSSDYTANAMTVWNPAEYLFEHNLIQYSYTP